MNKDFVQNIEAILEAVYWIFYFNFYFFETNPNKPSFPLYMGRGREENGEEF